jgi:hypothetical protein
VHLSNSLFLTWTQNLIILQMKWKPPMGFFNGNASCTDGMDPSLRWKGVLSGGREGGSSCACKKTCGSNDDEAAEASFGGGAGDARDADGGDGSNDGAGNDMSLQAVLMAAEEKTKMSLWWAMADVKAPWMSTWVAEMMEAAPIAPSLALEWQWSTWERGVRNNAQWLSRFSLQAVKRVSVGRKMVADRMGLMEVADMQAMEEK